MTLWDAYGLARSFLPPGWASRGIYPRLSASAPKIERDVVCAFGTTSNHPWVSEETENLTLESAYRVLTQHGLLSAGTRADWIVVGPIETLAISHEPHAPGQGLATHVRDLSGLSTDRVAQFFPVARETFQRWLSGSIQPGTANLERLLRLQYLFQQAQVRVSDTRAWLLTPLAPYAGLTPSDLLQQGRLTEVWDELQSIPARYANPRYVDAQGHRITQVLRSTRGRSLRTEVDELDDFSDWTED